MTNFCNLGIAVVSLAIIGFGSVGFVGPAEARPSTKSYSCEGVKAFVDQKGTVVMNTKRADIYRKFYSRNYECPFTQVHTAYKVPTKDGTCTLYICRPPKEPFFK